eukprot:4279379-Prymnesium_polylepis.1
MGACERDTRSPVAEGRHQFELRVVIIRAESRHQFELRVARVAATISREAAIELGTRQAKGAWLMARP